MKDEEKIKTCLVTTSQGNVLLYNVPQTIKPNIIKRISKELLGVKALSRVNYFKNSEINEHILNKFKKTILSEAYAPKWYLKVVKDYNQLNVK